jgi:hypothetical protein
MSIRTTVTLDDDVVFRLKQESKAKSVPFRTLINDVIRRGLAASRNPAQRERFVIEPFNMGSLPGIDYNDIGGLLELGEGESHR